MTEGQYIVFKDGSAIVFPAGNPAPNTEGMPIQSYGSFMLVE